MRSAVRLYEELSFNAVPALQTQFYDGWILRYTDGYAYTNRASSVNPLYPSSISLPAKIAECERRYFEQGLPAVFKFCGDAGTELEAMLGGRGYTVLTPTLLMTAKPAGGPDVSPGCVFTSQIDAAFLRAYFTFSGYTDPRRIAGGTRIMNNIQAAVLCARLVKDGATAACGLIVMERGYAGLFNVVVEESQRGKGYGKELCVSLLSAGMRLGIHTAYLQVIRDNQPAVNLYKTLGFQEEYTYWYRIKREGTS
jgi:ribosomal protein S18 acetylase RimI-like enzyme